MVGSLGKRVGLLVIGQMRECFTEGASIVKGVLFHEYMCVCCLCATAVCASVSMLGLRERWWLAARKRAAHQVLQVPLRPKGMEETRFCVCVRLWFVCPFVLALMMVLRERW